VAISKRFFSLISDNHIIMLIADIAVYIILLLGAILSYITHKLTLVGAISGMLVGLLIYKGTGYPGIAMLALFFMVSSWATGWQAAKKILDNSHENKSGRTAGQVLANGGVAALLGALAWYHPYYEPAAQLMIAGSFAAATADTLSSELGMIYGRRFFNVLTFKSDSRGLDGVVSLEGTLIGLAGVALIALIYAFYFGWGIPMVWIIIAGFVGNLVDSILGASLERKGFIGNNVVNFLNTAVGAGICWLLL
jgi:uncharacterized protein (TIGR00297 family)